MTKFTIIPSDNIVFIDDESYKVQHYKIDENIHAVQWYGSYGEVEYKDVLSVLGAIKPENKIIVSYEQFQPALDAWLEAKNKSD